MATKAKYYVSYFLSGLACLGLLAINGASGNMVQAAAWPTITRTVTPYRRPTPSYTPTQPSMTTRSLVTVNTGEIIEELYLFGSGAGAGTNCPFGRSKPGLDEEIATAPLMNPVSLWTCGWQPGENVQVRGQDPYGRSVGAFQMYAGADNTGGSWKGNIVLDFQPSIDSYAGNYTFTITGKSGTVTTNVRFTRPIGPHMYLLSNNPWQPVLGPPMGNRNRLLLWNFAPGEKVRVILYQYLLGSKMTDHQFLGYQDYYVPMNGQMEILIDLGVTNSNKSLFLIAYGDRSGRVGLSWFQLNEDQSLHQNWFDVYCPGAMQSRIDVNKYFVRAAYVDGTRLRIREKPGFSGRILQTVPEGTVLSLAGANPVRCVDKTFWWAVNLPGNEKNTGWVAETYNGKYIVESVNNR